MSDEACPLNLVPTASTIAALALGDALAMTLLVAKGFKQEDFANLHPGGKLGKRLMRVEQLMHGGEQTPIVRVDTSMPDVIYEMSRKASACRASWTSGDHLVGIITDGDLRRHMSNGTNILSRRAARSHDAPAGHRLSRDAGRRGAARPRTRKITSIVVVDAANLVQGVVHLHNLWRTGMV